MVPNQPASDLKTVRIYLPKLHNPDPDNPKGKRERVSGRHFDKVLRETVEYFQLAGITRVKVQVMDSTGWYLGQPEPQKIYELNVPLSEKNIEWLRKKKKEWGEKEMFDQEEIYITYVDARIVEI